MVEEVEAAVQGKRLEGGWERRLLSDFFWSARAAQQRLELDR